MDALSIAYHIMEVRCQYACTLYACTLYDTHLFCARYRVAQLLGYGGLLMTFFSTLIRSMRNS